MSQSYRPEPMQVGDGRWIIVEGGYVVVGFDDQMYFPTKEACEAEIAAREERGLILAEMFQHAKVEVPPGPPPKP